MSISLTPTLEDLLAVAIESYISEIHVSFPAKVQAFDNTKQTVDVLPQIKRPVTKADGSIGYESYPVIPSVQIAGSRSGKWFSSAPLASGDFVYVVCAERSLDEWRDLGDETEITNFKTHSIDGAVAFPVNVYPNSNPLSNTHASKMVMGKDDGARIYIDSDQINLFEENASQFVALAQKTYDEINALRSTVNALVTSFNSHVHPGVVVGPGSTAVPVVPATAPSAVNSVAAAKVKAT